MTPQEIADYKRRWMMEDNYKVKVHSDLRTECMEFAKEFIDKQHWDMLRWTDVYEDTYFFEVEEHAQFFRDRFFQWVTRD